MRDRRASTSFLSHVAEDLGGNFLIVPLRPADGKVLGWLEPEETRLDTLKATRAAPYRARSELARSLSEQIAAHIAREPARLGDCDQQSIRGVVSRLEIFFGDGSPRKVG